MFTIKEVWDQVCSLKIYFLTSAVASGRPLPLGKVSLVSDEILMSYLFFIPSTCPKHDVINFINFD